jgi:hypothetical protein
VGHTTDKHSCCNNAISVSVKSVLLEKFESLLSDSAELSDDFDLVVARVVVTLRLVLPCLALSLGLSAAAEAALSLAASA